MADLFKSVFGLLHTIKPSIDSRAIYVDMEELILELARPYNNNQIGQEQKRNRNTFLERYITKFTR